MAKIKIEEVVYALDEQFKKALVNTIKKVAPDVEDDQRMMFVDFRKELERQCQGWQSIPNSCVQREYF